MRIAGIDAVTLEHRLSEPLGTARQWFGVRRSLLVKITADDGTVGWGECGGTLEVSRTLVEALFAPRLAGEDPLRTTVLWELLSGLAPDGRGKGAYIQALSGIDLALWDLKGQALGVPVHALLGGAWADRVTTAAGGLFLRRGDAPARLADQVKQLVDSGYRALKLQVGPDVDDAALVRAARRAAGPEVRLAIDGDGAFAPRDAIRVGLNAAVEGVQWFQTPVIADDLIGLVEVRRVLAAHGLAIVAGATEADLPDLYVRGGTDLAVIDLCASGGFTGAQRIGVLARRFGVDLYLTSTGSAVSLAATLQVAATLPPPRRLGEPRMDLDRSENPLREELADEPPALEGDTLRLPSAPGLGLHLDDDRLARWRVG